MENLKKPKMKIYRDFELSLYDSKWWVVNEENGMCIGVDTRKQARGAKEDWEDWAIRRGVFTH